MTSLKTHIAIIPARAGSVRFPNKNRSEIAGETLLEITCRSIRASGYCKRIILSTDDPSLQHQGEQLEIEVHPRPADLATSDASSEAVLRHVIKHANLENEKIVLTQITSPLRTGDDIRATIEKAAHSPNGSAVSVTPWRVPPSPPYGSIDDSDILGECANEEWQKHAQLNARAWAVNGAVYVFSAANFLKTDKIYDPTSTLHVMENWRSIDIDYVSDLEIIKRLIPEKK
ncbi:acylneuraminate cytidylyltransferase family protein [Nisaea acidiphila]|uniref:Acylneuraminate cytidylyltransferase family protein n=1 Tax=Nisaea acidiphila TaxID=1862145 RepID=A0A9J7APV3_9PROT|nr:acylneuraminate cytidylyltransferase family protein [Nisaea acidiphila]UUX48388.1 acylneuraminate cytidylyltransferase family protein [Nisaea acidiphila]